MHSKLMSRPSIAVVIPTSNRPVDLMRALRSVYAQTLLPDEIIVVDDGSTPEVSTAVFSECPAGPECKLLRNADPSGPQVSRNVGLSAASADYVSFLDDDDEFLPEKIRVLTNHASGSAEVLYHPALMTYDDEGFSYVSSPASSISLTELLVRNLIGGTSMVCVAREPFLRIGAFDERMPALQDYEAWLRCAKRGLRFHYVPEALTRYHHDAFSGSISKSTEKFDRALTLLGTIYEQDYALLSQRYIRERDLRIVHMRTHRLLLSRQRWRAIKYCLRAMFQLRSTSPVLGLVPLVFGLRTTIRLKRRFGQ